MNASFLKGCCQIGCDWNWGKKKLLTGDTSCCELTTFITNREGGNLIYHRGTSLGKV